MLTSAFQSSIATLLVSAWKGRTEAFSEQTSMGEGTLYWGEAQVRVLFTLEFHEVISKLRFLGNLSPSDIQAHLYL